MISNYITVPSAPLPENTQSKTANCLITGNITHFDFFSGNQRGIRILSPKDCHALVCGGA